MATTVVPCKQCGIRTPYTELVAGPNNVWICPNCVNKNAKGTAPRGVVPPADASRPAARVLTNAPEMLPPSGNRSYKCEACNYGYRTDREMSGKMCPYCGQKGALRLKKSAAQLIKEVSELEL
ncbi:MAG: hypothetical protein Q7R96_03765 [Nanoarchaeota archaeon]|nr:hypothetical protein [Nanoarchaeota archaeon]